MLTGWPRDHRQKFVTILLLLLSCDFIFAGPNPAIMVAPAVAAQNARRQREEEERRRIHEAQYHQTVIEGEWKFQGCSTERVFTHKGSKGKKHYVYGIIRHYKRTDYYSCREHIHQVYEHNEFVRPANNEEIAKWNRDHKITIWVFSILGVLFVGLIIVTFIFTNKEEKKEEKSSNITYEDW